MRKQIKTKEMYVAEVQSLTEKHSCLLEQDQHLRDEFSGLLRTPQPSMWVGNNRLQRMSWEEIFFRIGELKSDAEYTCLLERFRNCRQELDDLKSKKDKNEPCNL